MGHPPPPLPHPTSTPFFSQRIKRSNRPLTSPPAPDTLDKTKVTGIEQVDTLQDGVHNLVAGQVGQGGLAQPVGDHFSKEGLNRAERQGKDDSGSYAPGPAGAVVNPLVEGGQQLGRGVGGMFGGAGSGKQRTNPVERK